jgi:hypothetical protein
MAALGIVALADNHSGVDYRMDESLPYLVYALSA